MRSWNFLVAAAVATAALAQPALADTTIKSQDGTVQLTVPNGWRERKPIGPDIKLMAISARGAVVLVRVSSKEDFKDLKSFTDVAIKRMQKNMPDAEAKTEDVQINNKPGIRVTMEGTQANGERKGYILTSFETDANFVNVVTLANASVFKTDEPTLAGLANQVKILGAPDAAAPAANPAAQSTPRPATPSGAPPAVRAPH